MCTKLMFLFLFIFLLTDINTGLAQENEKNIQHENADSTQNIVKKKGLFKKKKDKIQSKNQRYELSEEEIRLRNAHPDSLSSKERKQRDKSYKKEQKFYQKHGGQGNEALDPISQQLQQNPEYEGMKLNEQDIRILTQINKKYSLTKEEKQLQASNPDTLGLFQRLKIAKTYRKEYKRKKKLEKFWKKKIYSMQPPDAKARMKEHEKRIKKRDRRRRWQMRKKRFLNLFK